MKSEITKQKLEKYYKLTSKVLDEIKRHIVKSKKKEADEIYNNFDFDILDITETLIMEAVGFRHQYKKDDVSLSDAVGYLLARKYGLKFLTGDKFFENRDNVEFVK